MLEHSVFKLLLNTSFYSTNSRFLRKEMFPAELGTVLDTLQKAHEKYKKDLTVLELKELFLAETTVTAAQRRVLLNFFDMLEEEPDANPAIIQDIILAFLKKEKARKIGEMAARILNGEEVSFADISTEASENVQDTLVPSYEVVSKDLGELLKKSSPESRFKFSLQVLQDRVSGAGRGNFIIIFGRPEVGKSSLAASFVAGYLQQGLKVLYVGNEEPGYKVMLNIIRTCTKKGDLEMRDDVQKGAAAYPEWDAIKDNLALIDAVGMTFAELEVYAKNMAPDVIVVDQADKLSITGEYESNHLRLKDIYIHLREVAKRYNALVIGLSQASADAEGCRELTFDMLDGSKTGKAGEADIIIGVGKNAGVEEDFTRYLTVSKNKINGWHGLLTIMFNPVNCTFTG